MMHLVTVTGMLGSGKTTLILRLAEHAAGNGNKVAILVNEIGEIGIDNQFMRHLDFNVYELLGGCICCTLAGDLVQTLAKLEASHRPDIVMLEPSGAADPKNVIRELQFYRRSALASQRCLAVLDPLRFKMFWEVLEPLVTSLITLADTILINKVDLASAQEVGETADRAAALNPGAKLFRIRANLPLEPRLFSELMPCPS